MAAQKGNQPNQSGGNPALTAGEALLRSLNWLPAKVTLHSTVESENLVPAGMLWGVRTRDPASSDKRVSSDDIQHCTREGAFGLALAASWLARRLTPFGPSHRLAFHLVVA